MKDYWCLMCGQSGEKFKSPEELFTHMQRPHRFKDGSMTIYKGSKSEDWVDC